MRSHVGGPGAFAFISDSEVSRRSGTIVIFMSAILTYFGLIVTHRPAFAKGSCAHPPAAWAIVAPGANSRSHQSENIPRLTLRRKSSGPSRGCNAPHERAR